MIILFTDYGPDDIYVGQLKAALLRHAAAGAVIVDLLHRVPDFDAKAGAHLLAALQFHFPPGAVFLAVVDPGVGSQRSAAVLEADGRWFVGPDNGLLSVVAARAHHAHTWRIAWRPEHLSASFHGRDLFAPVAGSIAGGHLPSERLTDCAGLEVRLGGEDLAEVIYVDHYGNAMTGLRAQNVSPTMHLDVGGRRVGWARVFSEGAAGVPFWYVNSIGLAEIALPRGDAATALGLAVGTSIVPAAA